MERAFEETQSLERESGDGLQSSLVHLNEMNCNSVVLLKGLS